jgi:hypothetical protein
MLRTTLVSGPVNTTAPMTQSVLRTLLPLGGAGGGSQGGGVVEREARAARGGSRLAAPLGAAAAAAGGSVAPAPAAGRRAPQQQVVGVEGVPGHEADLGGEGKRRALGGAFRNSRTARRARARACSGLVPPAARAPPGIGARCRAHLLAPHAAADAERLARVDARHLPRRRAGAAQAGAGAGAREARRRGAAQDAEGDWGHVPAADGALE